MEAGLPGHVDGVSCRPFMWTLVLIVGGRVDLRPISGQPTTLCLDTSELCLSVNGQAYKLRLIHASINISKIPKKKVEIVHVHFLPTWPSCRVEDQAPTEVSPAQFQKLDQTPNVSGVLMLAQYQRFTLEL